MIDHPIRAVGHVAIVHDADVVHQVEAMVACRLPLASKGHIPQKAAPRPRLLLPPEGNIDSKFEPLAGALAIFPHAPLALGVELEKLLQDPLASRLVFPTQQEVRLVVEVDAVEPLVRTPLAIELAHSVHQRQRNVMLLLQRQLRRAL